MSCTISPITYFIEIRCLASLAKILAETNISRKLREIVLKILSMRDLVIFNVSDKWFISIPNQVRIFYGSHVDF